MTKPAKIEKRPLTEKQSLFCKYMYTIGSSSFGNGTESARRAGYKGNDNTLSQTAIKLVRNGRIIAEKKRIQAELEQESKLTKQQVLNQLTEGIKLSREKGDLRALARFTELQGKYLAMWTDRVQSESTGKLELTAIQQRELKALAQLRLRQLAGGDRLLPDKGDSSG